MLTLSRKTDEAILIGSDIRIVIKRIDGEIVKLGIEAPKNVPIYREEIFATVSRQNREALAQGQPSLAPGTELRLKLPRSPQAPDIAEPETA